MIDHLQSAYTNKIHLKSPRIDQNEPGDVIVFEGSVSKKPYWVIEDKDYEKLCEKAVKLTQRVIIDDHLRFFASLD